MIGVKVFVESGFLVVSVSAKVSFIETNRVGGTEKVDSPLACPVASGRATSLPLSYPFTAFYGLLYKEVGCVFILQTVCLLQLSSCITP